MAYKKRLDPDYEKWRKTILNRDNGKCQMPYCESKRQLIVHHIIPYAKSTHLRTDPNNGITLCRKCHKQTFGKELQYSHIFLSIIKANEQKKKNNNKAG